jgi:hypothetical protein
MKLIKCTLLFHLVIIINCNVKRTHKISSVINSIYSGQQQFSYSKVFISIVVVSLVNGLGYLLTSKELHESAPIEISSNCFPANCSGLEQTAITASDVELELRSASVVNMCSHFMWQSHVRGLLAKSISRTYDLRPNVIKLSLGL